MLFFYFRLILEFKDIKKALIQKFLSTPFKFNIFQQDMGSLLGCPIVG